MSILNPACWSQVIDIQSEGKKDVTLETLQWIHEHKTVNPKVLTLEPEPYNACLEFTVVLGGISASQT